MNRVRPFSSMRGTLQGDSFELKPYSRALNCYSALYDQQLIDKWTLTLNQCDERKQNSLVQKFAIGLRRPQRFDAIQA